MSAISILDVGFSDLFPSILVHLSPQQIMECNVSQEMRARVSSFASEFLQQLEAMRTLSGRLEHLVMHVKTMDGSDIQKIGYIYRRILDDYKQLPSSPSYGEPSSLFEMLVHMEDIQDAHADALNEVADRVAADIPEVKNFIDSLGGLVGSVRAYRISQWMYEHPEFFVNIDRLGLAYCEKLSRIPPEITLFKCLESLSIGHCDLLKCLPRELLQLQGLLSIEGVSDTFRQSFVGSKIADRLADRRAKEYAKILLIVTILWCLVNVAQYLRHNR